MINEIKIVKNKYCIFVRRIFWQISNETVENQDLYIDKDDF